MSTSGLHSTDRLLAPIQSLPNELLAAIFAYGARISHTKRNRDKGLPFPLLVSSVNRHWRAVAMSSPSVWSCVSISGKQPLDVTDTWVRRSKGCLLDVTLNLRCVRREDVDRMIDLIAPHVARWRRFSLDAMHHSHVEKVLSRVRETSAPHLEHFFIKNFGYIAGHYRRSQILAQGTPMLRTVQLEHVPLWCAPPLVGLRFLHLNNVRPTYTEIRDIAATCPLLTELILRTFYPNLRLNEQVPTIYFPSLQSLAINFDHCQNSVLGQSFLSFVVFPNLEYLELSRCRLPDLFEYFPRNKQRPWFPKLHTLRLSHATISNSVKFLHSLSNIVHLQLIHLGDILKPAEESSAQFAGEDELISLRNRCVWPHLKIITLETNLPNHLDALYMLVRYRIDINRPLTRVRLSQPIHQHPIGRFQLRFMADGREGDAPDLVWLQERVEVELLHDQEVGLINKM